MAEQNNKKGSKIHGLVLFKGVSGKEKPDESTYAFESVDQEKKIKLAHQLVPYRSAYLYSIMLINDSLAPITEIKIKIKFPEFLILSRINPPEFSANRPQRDELGSQQVNLEIDELSETSQKQINFYFNPIPRNNKGDINTYITYVNNKDFVRVLNSDTKKIEIVLPKIEPKIISSAKISEFLKIEGIKKAVKSLGIGTKNKVDLDLYFSHIEQLLGMHKFQLIAKDDKKRIAWFYGTDLSSKQEILVIGQIVSDKVEFLAAAQIHPILISLLAILSEDYKKRITSIGIVKSTNEIYDLECEFCGAIFERFPAKGELIECKNCHREQTVW